MPVRYRSAATHAVSAIVAEIAVTVSHGDRAALVAAWGIFLEGGELLAARGRRSRGHQFHDVGAGRDRLPRVVAARVGADGRRAVDPGRDRGGA